MLSPRWRKVLRDLSSNVTRTALVVLSIAVGVFAIGAVASSRQMIAQGMQSGYEASNPASATLFTDELWGDELVETVRRMRGVADAEARRSLGVKVRLGDEWKDMNLVARPDYDDLRIGTVRSVAGEWPPSDKQVLLERATATWLGVTIGDRITVKTLDADTQRVLLVAGIVHNANSCPPFFCQSGEGNVDLDTIEWLGEAREFNQLDIVVAENRFDQEHITTVARRVEDKLQKGGYDVTGTNVPEPGKHPIAQVVDTLVLLLGVLGFFSLLLSGFLVVNTISALLTQQTRQIGVMKSIGATNRAIMCMYLVTVAIFGLLSLLIAVPLGGFGARLFADYIAGLFNFDVTSYRIPPLVLGLQVVTALLVPLLAALVPVVLGTRITVREAISGYGLSSGGNKQKVKGKKDRFVLGWLQSLRHADFTFVRLPFTFLSRPVLLSLRNTFRRKARLALTLTTLTLAGAIFIAVLSVRASVALTLQDVFAYYNSDVFVIANQPYRAEVLDRLQTIPGVAAVEGWNVASYRRERPDGTESNPLSMIALPAETGVFNPKIVAGRWLLPNDENALVVNSELLEEDPDAVVGSTITLKINGRDTQWRVVGVVQVLLDERGVYVNQPYFGRITGEVGRASWVNLLLSDRSAAAQERVARAAEAHFAREGLEAARILTASENSAQAQSQFDIIIVLLLLMAVLLAVVGGLGLMGTMSINVLERTREIGVMRAIGASDGAVLRVIMAEGLLIGALSWTLGALIALPISRLLSDAVGMAFIQTPFSFTFSLLGTLAWLAIVLLLAALASWLPAWNASRLTVRDILAYE